MRPASVGITPVHLGCITGAWGCTPVLKKAPHYKTAPVRKSSAMPSQKAPHYQNAPDAKRHRTTKTHLCAPVRKARAVPFEKAPHYQNAQMRKWGALQSYIYTARFRIGMFPGGAAARRRLGERASTERARGVHSERRWSAAAHPALITTQSRLTEHTIAGGGIGSHGGSTLPSTTSPCRNNSWREGCTHAPEHARGASNARGPASEARP